MFSICESMRWTHLPEEGGLNKQDPDLLEGFQVIFAARAKYEAKQAEERDRKMAAQSRSNRRVAGRR